MCGEKLSAVFTSCINLGSPPRVRGKEYMAMAGWDTEAITPACAGKRVVRDGACVYIWDHPRVCGEKLGAAASF